MKLTTIASSAILLATTISWLPSAACHADNAVKPEAQHSLFTNAPGSPISIPDDPGNVVIGDVNNDKNLDLVVACGRSRKIIVLPGKGNGEFGPPTSTTTVSESPGEIALGDVNGDGKLDLAVTSHDSYGAQIFLGDGKGAFTIAPTSPIMMRVGEHPHTHGLALTDMNRDNKLDLVTVNSTDNDVSLAFGDGRGGFTRAPRSPFAVGPSPYPFAIGDVNGDGQPDIIATATATGPLRAQQLPMSKALTLLLSDGQGGFRSSQLPMRTGEPWFAVISDFNGDRKSDIAVTHHDQGELTIMLGDARGGFVEAPASPLNFGVRQAFHAVAGDVNRDGKIDVIAAAGEGVRLMLGDGRGGFTAGPAAATGRGTWRIGAADFNRDGKMDLVTTNNESRSVSVLLGT